jgi:hypothetical protein
MTGVQCTTTIKEQLAQAINATQNKGGDKENAPYAIQ